MENRLISMLRNFKREIEWTMVNIIGISSSVYSHKIQVMRDLWNNYWALEVTKSTKQEVKKKTIIKWLDIGIVYPISYNNWVIMVQFMTKKSGITVVSNTKNEVVPIRSVTYCRVYFDDYNLNLWKGKYHLPRLLMD